MFDLYEIEPVGHIFIWVTSLEDSFWRRGERQLFFAINFSQNSNWDRMKFLIRLIRAFPLLEKSLILYVDLQILLVGKHYSVLIEGLCLT